MRAYLQEAARLFTRVTGSDEIVAQRHKNNADSELVLDEFFKYLFHLALAHTTGATKGAGGAKRLIPPATRFSTFLTQRVLKRATQEMPVDRAALARAVGANTEVGSGYDGIESVDEQFTGEALAR